MLDGLHDAAADADGDRYWVLFSDDAVFMGTDASERWTIDEFRAYGQAGFDTGTGWTYEVEERFVSFSGDGRTAWFDEVIRNDKYGACRGTGVLKKVDETWRIAHYNLTIPIPNDLAADVRDTTAEDLGNVVDRMVTNMSVQMSLAFQLAHFFKIYKYTLNPGGFSPTGKLWVICNHQKPNHLRAPRVAFIASLASELNSVITSRHAMATRKPRNNLSNRWCCNDAIPKPMTIQIKIAQTPQITNDLSK